jgi:hypothetical protein
VSAHPAWPAWLHSVGGPDGVTDHAGIGRRPRHSVGPRKGTTGSTTDRDALDAGQLAGYRLYNNVLRFAANDLESHLAKRRREAREDEAA